MEDAVSAVARISLVLVTLGKYRTDVDGIGAFGLSNCLM